MNQLEKRKGGEEIWGFLNLDKVPEEEGRTGCCGREEGGWGGWLLSATAASSTCLMIPEAAASFLCELG